MAWLKELGLFVTEGAVVISNDAPAAIKAVASVAKEGLGARVQICDGVDDRASIIAAVAALPAGGGTVKLSEGTFYFDVTGAGGEILKSNVTFEGSGQATIIKWNGSSIADTGYWFPFYGKSNITFRNIRFEAPCRQGYVIGGLPDGGTHSTNITIENCQFTAPVAADSGTASGGTVATLVDVTKAWTPDQWIGRTVTCYSPTAQHRIVASNTANTLTIAGAVWVAPGITTSYRIWAQGDEHHFLNFYFVDGLTVKDCYFEYAGDEASDIWGCSNILYEHNKSYRCGAVDSAGGSHMDFQFCSGLTISKCWYEDAWLAGNPLFVYASSLTDAYDSLDTEIKGCHFKNTGGPTISADNARDNRRVDIHDNIVENSTGYGICVINSGTGEITDVSIHDNILSGVAGLQGILLYVGNCSRFIVTNNQINGFTTQGIYVGHCTALTSGDDITIEDNKITGCGAGTGIYATPFAGVTITNLHIRDNDIVGAGDGIGVYTCNYAEIKGNTVKDITNNGIFIASDYATVEHNMVDDCAAAGIGYNPVTGGTCKFNRVNDCLTGIGANAAATGIRVTDNQVSNAKGGGSNFSFPGASLTGNSFKRNYCTGVGGTWRSENSGTATVTAANVGIVVTHGLLTTPARVLVSATLWSLSNKAWVTPVGDGSVQFTINVDVVPGVGTAIFDWRAIVGEDS